MSYGLKTGVLRCLESYVTAKHNINVSVVEKIDTVPTSIRHSCPQTGIVELRRQVAQIFIDGYPIEIPYFVCTVCGKLYVYADMSY